MKFLKKFYFLIKAFVVVVFVFSLTIPFLPKICSSSFGKGAIVNVVKFFSGGNVEIGFMNLTWNKGQVIDNLYFIAGDGSFSFSFEKFETKSSMWDIFFKNVLLENGQLKSPKVVLEDSYVEKTSGGGEKSLASKFRFALPFTGDIFVDDGTLIFKGGGDDVIFSNLNASVNIPSSRKIFSVTVDGATQCGDIFGNLHLETWLKGFDGDGFVHFSKDDKTVKLLNDGECCLHCEVENLPIEGFSKLVSFDNSLGEQFFSNTFGSNISLFCDVKIDKENSSVVFNANSSKFRISLKGDVDEGNFVSKNGSCAIALNSKSFKDLQNFFWGNEFFDICEETIVNADISDFSFSLNGEYRCARDFLEKVSLMGKLSTSNCKLTSQNDFLNLKNVDFNVDIDGAKDALNASCNVVGNFNGIKKFALNFSGEFLKISEKMDGKFCINSSGFPVGIFSCFFRKYDLFFKALGKGCDFNVLGNVSNGDIALDISKISSETFNVNGTKINFSEGVFELEKPLEVNYIVPKRILNYCFQKGIFGDRVSSSIVVDNDFSFSVSCDKLKFSLVDEWCFPEDLSSSFSVILKKLGVKGVPSVGACSLENVTIDVDCNSLQDVNFKVAGKILGKQFSFVDDILGPKTSFIAEGKGFFSRENSISVPHIYCNVESDKLNFKGNFQCLNGYDVSLENPTTINYSVSSKLFKDCIGQSSLSLFDDCFIYCEVSHMAFSLGDIFSTLLINGDVKSQEIKFKSSAFKIEYPSFKDVEISFVVDAIRNIFSGSCNFSLFSSPTQFAGIVDVNFDANDIYSKGSLNFERGSVFLKCSVDKFPIPFLESMFDMEGDLAPFLGSTLFCVLDTRSREGGVEARVNFHSDHCNVNGNYFVGNDGIVKNENGTIVDFSITPSAFSKFVKIANCENVDSLTLSKSMKIKISLDKFICPWRFFCEKPSKGILQNIEYDARVISEDISIVDDSDEFVVKNFNAEANSESLCDLSAKISGDILFKNNVSKNVIQGKISGSIEAENVFGDNFAFDEAIHGKGYLFVENVSSQWVSKFFKNKVLKAFFGEKLSSRISLDFSNAYNGRFSATFNGDGCDFGIEGYAKDGVCYLSKSIEAQFWSNFDDIFDGIVVNSHTSPISLKIAADGTSIDCKDFNMEKVNVGNSVIDFGRWNFSCEKVNFFKNFVDMILESNSDNVDLWMLPINFHIDKGKLFFDRSDVLLQGVHVISWGNLSRSSTDVVMGITTESLGKHFFLKDDLPKNCVIKIPLAKKNGSIEIDWKKVAKTISLLKIADSTKKIKTFDGLLGFALNATLNKLSEKNFIKIEDIPKSSVAIPWIYDEKK